MEQAGSTLPHGLPLSHREVLTVQTLPAGVPAALEKTGCKTPGVLMDVIKATLKIKLSSSASTNMLQRDEKRRVLEAKSLGKQRAFP